MRAMEFDPKSVEILRQRLEAKLETATPEDRRFILDAVGAKVLVQADGAWELELQVPRGVPAAEGPVQEGVLQTVSDGPGMSSSNPSAWRRLCEGGTRSRPFVCFWTDCY